MVQTNQFSIERLDQALGSFLDIVFLFNGIEASNKCSSILSVKSF